MTKANSPSRSKRNSAKPARSRVSSNQSKAIAETSGKKTNGMTSAEYQRDYRRRRTFDPRMQLRVAAQYLTPEEARELLSLAMEMRPDLFDGTM